MWKAEEFEITLPLLEASPYVGEVLLINNDVPRTPSWFRLLSWRKVKVYSPPSNIFVNPAFNLGVASAQYQQICLLQDDIVFDPAIFYHLGTILTNKVGVIGSDASCMFKVAKQRLLPEPPRNVKIEPVPLPILFGYATMMVLHKDNYIPIDESLKIHLGEEWIVQTHLRLGLTPLVMKNFKLRLLGAKTTSDSTPELRAYKEKESKSHQFIKDKLDTLFTLR